MRPSNQPDLSKTSRGPTSFGRSASVGWRRKLNRLTGTFRFWLLCTCLAVFVLATVAASRQEVRLDPRSPTLFSRGWWTAPIERNVVQRLPDVTGTLSAAAVSPNGQTVCLVGQDGTIEFSFDRGRNWTTVGLQNAEAGQSRQQPQAKQQQQQQQQRKQEQQRQEQPSPKSEPPKEDKAPA